MNLVYTSLRQASGPVCHTPLMTVVETRLLRELRIGVAAGFPGTEAYDWSSAETDATLML